MKGHEGKSARKNFFAFFLLIISILVLIIALSGRGGKEERPATPPVKDQETPVSQPQRVQEETPPQAQEGEYATVVEVVDGDTIKVMFLDGRMETVRYIGINAPEMGQPYAAEARAFNSSLVSGKEVRMEWDVSERDRYGTLLRCGSELRWVRLSITVFSSFPRKPFFLNPWQQLHWATPITVFHRVV